MIRNVTFGGFGGTIKGVNAYFINLKLGDIEFSDMPVIASKLANAEFDIVLPATLFKDIVYTINMWDYKIEINSMLKNIKINFKINKDMWISILLTDTYEESNIKYIERIINFNPTPQDIEANYINNLINNQDTP